MEIEADDELADIVSGGFDAGIRLGESLQPDMIAVQVDTSQRMAVVGSPSYFARLPKPETPRELSAHACIRRRFRGGAIYKWEFERAADAFDIAVEGCQCKLASPYLTMYLGLLTAFSVPPAP